MSDSECATAQRGAQAQITAAGPCMHMRGSWLPCVLLLPMLSAEAAAKAQARLDAMLAEDATTSQATGEGGEGDMGGAEEGGGEQRPRSVGGSSKATVSELVSAHMLLGPPVLLALGVAYMMGPSACNGVLQC